MATNERSVELAGVNLAGQNHVCAFFNTMDEERTLRLVPNGHGLSSFSCNIVGGAEGRNRR